MSRRLPALAGGLMLCAGGRAVLIQTGDVLDGGKDSRSVIALLRRLEREARGAGGQMLALTGNHEFMRLAGDWRYVSAGEYDAFRDGGSVERRDTVRARAAAAAEERARAEQRPFDAAAFREQFHREVPLTDIGTFCMPSRRASR